MNLIEGVVDAAGEGEEEEEDAAEEEGGGSKVGTMKDGEYLLHVLVETGKTLDLEGEDTVDPMVKVLFMGKELQTTAKNDITRSSTVKWDEHLFLEVGEVKAGDIQEAMIEVQILNKGFFKSDLVGSFAVSAAKIYDRADHVLHNQPLAFTNPTATNKAKITG